MDALVEAPGHHGHMTSPSPRIEELPPDPIEYDSPRAERARAKGLQGPYITGGNDPELAVAQAEERRLGKILLAMVIVIVSAGFVIGIAIALLMPSAA